MFSELFNLECYRRPVASAFLICFALVAGSERHKRGTLIDIFWTDRLRT